MPFLTHGLFNVVVTRCLEIFLLVIASLTPFGQRMWFVQFQAFPLAEIDFLVHALPCLLAWSMLGCALQCVRLWAASGRGATCSEARVGSSPLRKLVGFLTGHTSLVLF